MRQAWYSQLKGLAKEAAGYALKGEVSPVCIVHVVVGLWAGSIGSMRVVNERGGDGVGDGG